MELKEVFALRLRQYAEEWEHIQAAIQRALEYDDEDYSPSKYTPSLNQSRANADNLYGIVKGYCLAVDDALGRDHGVTELRWHKAIDDGLAFPAEPVDIPTNDSGYITHGELKNNDKADKIFGSHVL